MFILNYFIVLIILFHFDIYVVSYVYFIIIIIVLKRKDGYPLKLFTYKIVLKV